MNIHDRLSEKIFDVRNTTHHVTRSFIMSDRPLASWKRNIVLNPRFTEAVLFLLPFLWQQDMYALVGLLAFVHAEPLRVIMFVSRRDPYHIRRRKLTRGPWTLEFEYHHGHMKLMDVARTGHPYIHANSSSHHLSLRAITLHKAFAFLLHRQVFRTSQFHHRHHLKTWQLLWTLHSLHTFAPGRNSVLCDIVRDFPVHISFTIVSGRVTVTGVQI
jgi:hypothetical protein